MTDIQEEKVDEIKRSFSKVYDYVSTNAFVEISGNKYGDLVTYRVYNDGSVTESKGDKK